MTGKLPPHPPEEPWHVHQPFPPHHHHHHDPHHVAPECDDQLAMFSGVGRGLRGDGYKVVIRSDVEAETYLEGLLYDAATNTYSSEWISENINGGQLMYQYNLRPYTSPQTFTITFRYKRPNRSASEWVWTTPAIPYIWDADDDGLADVDSIVGTGVATLFLKKTTEPQWVMSNLPTSYSMAEALNRQEKLIYPEDWTREMFNAPIPDDPWTVNLQYGINGDIDAPNIDDLAKILGITVQQIRNIIADQHDQITDPDHNISADNIKDYIDAIDDHIHDDMGFDDHLIGDDNDVVRNTIKKYIDGLRDDLYDNLGVTDPSTNFYNDNGDLSLTYVQKYGSNAGTTTTHKTIKAYIDARCDDLQEGLTAVEGRASAAETNIAHINNSLADIVNKFFGGGTIGADGHITWPNGNKAAVGNINVLSSTTANAILTHTGTATGDLKGE